MLKSRLLGAVGIVVVVVGSVAGALAAQTSARPAFEVVSIKRSRADEAGGGSRVEPGGRFTATNIPTASLLSTAFGTDRPLFYSQIAGMPVWATADRFDITAKPGSDLPSDAAAIFKLEPALLRALLEDRFKLRAHMETRDEPIYELVKARADGRLGPGLRVSAVDCAALRQQGRDNPSSAPPLPSVCTIGLRFGAGTFSAGSTPIANLVSTLSGAVERMVVDRTGLAGNFTMELKWTPAGLPVDPSSGDVPPSIFTAVQDQLGLKLESAKGPVDVLVIEHIEHPTED